jgi:hypothetical protein
MKPIDTVKTRFTRNSATSTRVPTDRAPFLITCVDVDCIDAARTFASETYATHLWNRS